MIMMEMLHNIQIDQPAPTNIDPDADEQDIDLYGKKPKKIMIRRSVCKNTPSRSNQSRYCQPSSDFNIVFHGQVLV